MSSKLKKAFSRKPKILKLEFSPMKTALYSSRKMIMIGDKMYMRKDFVEERIADVINVKIAKGELKEVKKVQSTKYKVVSNEYGNNSKK